MNEKMKNVLLTISYDGSGFFGWQIQPRARTVQGVLEETLSKVCGESIRIEGTSRTDAGVHALGQKATFQGTFGIPLEKLKMVMNRALPEDVKIEAVQQVDADFHARFSARGKTYSYRIRNSSEKDVFGRNYFYTVEEPLDVEAMKRGAIQFIGTHDFKAFMATGSTPQKSTSRTIYQCQVDSQPLINAQGEAISLSVTGDGFLYNMVRIMAGTLVDVGRGQIQPEQISRIIAMGDRSKAGRTAPPQGLYLSSIYFNQEDIVNIDIKG